jgi:hypothetical protein
MVTMSQKSSVPQTAKSVSQALIPDIHDVIMLDDRKGLLMEVMIAHAAFLKDFKPTCDSTSPGRMLIGEPSNTLLRQDCQSFRTQWDRAPDRESRLMKRNDRVLLLLPSLYAAFAARHYPERTHERSALPTRHTRRVWR